MLAVSRHVTKLCVPPVFVRTGTVGTRAKWATSYRIPKGPSCCKFDSHSVKIIFLLMYLNFSLTLLQHARFVLTTAQPCLYCHFSVQNVFISSVVCIPAC